MDRDEEIRSALKERYVRQSVVRRYRELVAQRDSYTCQYCNTQTGDDYHIDHVIPGPYSEPFNLVLACKTCNRRKSASVWIPNNLKTITAKFTEWERLVMKYADPLRHYTERLETKVTPQQHHHILTQSAALNISAAEYLRRLIEADREGPKD